MRRASELTQRIHSMCAHVYTHLFDITQMIAKYQERGVSAGIFERICEEEEYLSWYDSWYVLGVSGLVQVGRQSDTSGERH